jgi:glucose-1-phosphate thymidylyltransferase
MKALILAAGYATRLYPLTRKYPKPLLMVESKPIISHITAKLEKIGCLDEIIVVTNSRFFRLFNTWKKRAKTAKALTLVNDLTKDNSTRLGAVGDTAFAVNKRKLCDDLLVIGGDNLFDEGLAGFMNTVRKVPGHPVIGVFDIKSLKSARNYGVLKIDRLKKVVSFREKPARPESTLVGMCLYYFPAQTIGFIGEYLKGKGHRDAMGSYIAWLYKKVPVYAYEFSGRWYDIGDHEFYSRARSSFVNG